MPRRVKDVLSYINQSGFGNVSNGCTNSAENRLRRSDASCVFRGRQAWTRLRAQPDAGSRVVPAHRPGRQPDRHRLAASGSMPAIIIGSHIDTVPGGGMFDGALGVIGGLEVLTAMHEAGYEGATQSKSSPSATRRRLAS